MTEVERLIRSIKRTAFNAGFMEGIKFAIEKCMDDFLIGSEKMIEYPKSEEETELLKREGK